VGSPSFFADAECKGLETCWFFPWGGGPEMRPGPLAVQACSRCKVREDCLTWSIGPPMQAGYWGGMTEPERIAERARRYSDERTERRRAARRAAEERQDEVAA
jgi:hypothetical protein